MCISFLVKCMNIEINLFRILFITKAEIILIIFCEMYQELKLYKKIRKCINNI